MKLSQVKGNTWVAEGIELIPLYRLPGGRCILLDTGLEEERDDLEAALLHAGLTPAAVLCSHAHVDHCANNRYFQEKYRIPVALTGPEAGMCCSILNLKCYTLVISPDMARREMASMVHTPDLVIPPVDGPFSLLGTEFQIVQTPGHSSGHISTVTPDNVCYVGDALLSEEYLGSKLPYCLSHQQAMASREKLRGLGCDAYIMAHRGTARELGPLIDSNQALVRERAEEIFSLIDQPMPSSQVALRACALYKLFTRKPRRALRFERNIRFLIEYLVDTGRLEMETRSGVVFYRRAELSNDPGAASSP